MTPTQALRRIPSALARVPVLGLGLALALACSAPIARQLSGEEEQALRRYEERAAELRRIPLDLTADDRLILRGLDGDVRVVASRRGVPELLARLGTRALEPHEARAMLHRLEFEIEREGASLIVRLVRPDLEELVLTDSSYEVALPAGAAVEVEARPGNVVVEGPFRACTASSRFGSVRVRDIQGDVRIANGAGDVHVEGARGSLIDVSTAGQVELRRSQAATVQAHSASGKVSIWNVEAETITASSDHGAVTLQGVRGNVTASCGSGPLSLVDGVGERFELIAVEGPLRVEGASGALQLSAPGGDIHVSDASGRLDARSTYGSIAATGLFEHVRTVSTSGSIEVEALPGSAPVEAWYLESSYADVELRLPADAAFELHARTVYGEVEPEFPLLIEAGRSSGENTLRGRLNGGGPLLELTSITGTLRLRRRVR